MGPPGARWGTGSTANCLLNIKGEWGPLELEPYEEPMRPQSNRRPLNREKMGLFQDYRAPWSYRWGPESTANGPLDQVGSLNIPRASRGS